MAFYDDKRFILSHIRHSFITCDDTGKKVKMNVSLLLSISFIIILLLGMCETVMLNEPANRYPLESLYHHPFEYDSDAGYNNDFSHYYDHDDFYDSYLDDDDHNIIDYADKASVIPECSLSLRKRVSDGITQEDLDFFRGKIQYK